MHRQLARTLVIAAASADASRAVMSAPMKPDHESDTSGVNGAGEKPSRAECAGHRQTPARRFNMVSPPHAPGACTSVADSQRKNKRRLDARAA